MKPPVRARSAPQRYGVESERLSEEDECESEEWTNKELRLLLRALSRQSAGSELDLCAVEFAVPSRSPAEIASYIERLRLRSTRSAIQRDYNQRLQERQRKQQQLRAPLQIWTELAEAVTGRLDEVISTAVSQTLMIAATEPVCREHSVPPPTPQGQGSMAAGTESAGEPAGGPHHQLPVREEAAGSSLSELEPQALHVDFARIYRLLSAMVRGTALPQLSALESAVVLDLLMSLPEELEGLSRGELGTHMEWADSRLHRTSRCSRPLCLGQELGHPAPLPAGPPASLPTGAPAPLPTGPPAPLPSGPPAPLPAGPPAAAPGSPHQTHSRGSQQAGAWPLNPFVIPLNLLVRAQKPPHSSLTPTVEIPSAEP